MRQMASTELAFLGFLLLLGAGCSTAYPTAGEAEAPARSFGFTSPGRDGVARLDDVTNATEDVRVGTENYFEDSTADRKAAAPATIPLPTRSDRKMIYSASFTVMVTTIEESVQRLIARVEALGGYLSTRHDATLTVRIPADRFQTLIREVPEFGRVLSESMQAADVTNQHTDLTIRLENAETARRRLLTLLDKAEKMEDILKIEAALTRLTGEIEQMKGQLKLLNNQIAFSTVSVSFQSNAPPVQDAERRRRSRFAWINRIGIEQDLKRF